MHGAMSHTLPCELISWNRLHGLLRRLARRIQDSGFRPDLVVAIGRGGYIPARMLVDHLGLMTLTSIRLEHYRGASKGREALIRDPLLPGTEGGQVLVVDDVSDTGDTFSVAVAHLHGHLPGARIRTAALHHKAVSRYRPDFHGQLIKQWRWLVYPWAMIEDLCGFVYATDPRPESPQQLAHVLHRDYGLRPPRPVLEDVMDALARGTWASDT
jgi:hypoxanthine phosphoribosyltransferase